jgi:predicted dehydrogenase
MKILIAGLGSIGKRHATNAAKFAETAVFDIDRDAAETCRRELRLRSFSDFQTALEWKPDGVVVATPTSLHIPASLAAVDAGADVLVEKPISHSVDGVDNFLNRAEIFKRKVFVACNMRFHPAIKSIRENLDLIGRPLFARAHYGNYLPDMRLGVDYRTLYAASRKQGGGAVLDGIHELDYLTWLFGSVGTVLCHAQKLSDLEIDTEDYASISLRHISGVASEIHLDYLRPFKRRGCEVVGEQGMFVWQSEGKKPEKCSVRLYERKTGSWKSVFCCEDVDLNRPYEEMMEHFVNGMRGRDVPLLRGRQAAEELSVVLRALKMSQIKAEE